MKKLIIAGSVLMLIGVFGLTPTVHAKVFGDYQSWFSGFRNQNLPPQQVGAVGVPVVLGACPAGTVGAGKKDETLRCDGSKWVASGNLMNDGDNVGIGQPAIYGSKLTVHSIGSDSGITSDSISSYGVYGASTRDNGVVGSSVEGVGVRGQTYSGGERAIAVKAVNNFSSYGFYQEGAQAKNYFEGTVGIKTEPATRSSLSVKGIGIGESVAIQATNTGGGSGIFGSSDGGISIEAWQPGTSYGFFQSGDQAKNYFEGKVGIGTRNPGAKLDVVGQVKISGGSPSEGKVLTSDATGLARWEAPQGGGGDGYWTSAGGNTIKNTNTDTVYVGNVATNGATKLSVVGNTSGTVAVVENQSTSYSQKVLKVVSPTNSDTALIFQAAGGSSDPGPDTGLVVRGNNEVSVSGGLRVNKVNANRPSCDSTRRGVTWFTEGGSGTKDTMAVCAKDAGGAYAWRTLY